MPGRRRQACGRRRRPRRAQPQYRTDGLNKVYALYSLVRGKLRRRRSARTLLARRPGLVRSELRGPDRSPVPRLGRHRPGRSHADPRSDRQRQDPRRLPLRTRPPGPRPQPAGNTREPRPRPGPLHLSVEGPDLRRGAQPESAARPGSAWPRKSSATSRPGSPSRAGPATRPARTVARSPAVRPTSSSRLPRACTCCSRARPARSCATSST